MSATCTEDVWCRSSRFDVVTRRANTADLDELMVLIRRFNEEDRHSHDDFRVRRALEPLLVDDALGQVWVVDGPRGLLGYCVVTWSYSLESGGRECIVDEIYVTTQSTGLGSQLLRESMNAARRAGVRVAFLETEAHNVRARGFYSRHDFEVEDSIWMRRQL